MSASQMYPNLWGGFPWFSIHEDSQGVYYGCGCSLLYQLSSWLIYPLGKSIILVIGDLQQYIYIYTYIYTYIYIYIYVMPSVRKSLNCPDDPVRWNLGRFFWLYRHLYLYFALFSVLSALTFRLRNPLSVFCCIVVRKRYTAK